METLSVEAKEAVEAIVKTSLGNHKDPNSATKAELQEFAQKLANATIALEKANSDIAILSKQNDDMAAQLKAGTKELAEEYTSLEKALKAALKASHDKITAIVKANGKQSEPLTIEVGTKAAVDMSVENTIGAGATQYTITQNTGIISTIRQREEVYLRVVSAGSIGSARALWIEETDQQGTPIFIGEGDPKTQLSVKYVEQLAPVRKIAVYGKVTTELMEDTPQLMSYIQNNLVKRLSIATEDALFNGDGTGDNIKGVIPYATAFDAAEMAATVQDANEFDVLEAVALQVEKAYGKPNAVFVHPSTWRRMKTIKDDNNRPLWKEYVEPNGDIVYDGMRIIRTTAITAGNFVAGDFSVVNVLYRSGITVQIGLDGNDFTNNKKTILVEQRLVQFVSANDTPVLVKGDFTSAKAALNAI